MSEQLISHSRLRAYATCPRLHHIKYVLGYRGLERSYALDWGTLMHRGLEEWWRLHGLGRGVAALEGALAAIRDSEASDIDKAKARVIMTGYDLMWGPAMVDYKVLAVEQEFKYPVTSEDGRTLFCWVGKIDGIIEHIPTQRQLVLEHKNTKADFGPADSYWTGLLMEPQVSQYYQGARSLGYSPVGCLWDVLRRPEIKQYRKTANVRLKKDGEPYANQRLADETEEEFITRLADLIAEDPEHWYARKEVVRLPSELQAFDRDSMYTAEKCLDDCDEFKHVARNPDACHNYGRLCEMWPVCSGSGSLSDESKYRKVYNNGHEELSTL